MVTHIKNVGQAAWFIITLSKQGDRYGGGCEPFKRIFAVTRETATVPLDARSE